MGRGSVTGGCTYVFSLRIDGLSGFDRIASNKGGWRGELILNRKCCGCEAVGV